MTPTGRNKDSRRAAWYFGGALLFFLVTVAFWIPDPTAGQIPIIRFCMAALSGFFAYFFFGSMHLKAKIAGQRIAASGGFSLFVLIQIVFDPYALRSYVGDRYPAAVRSDNEVREVQEDLKRIGLIEKQPDGVRDSVTTKAIKAVQQKFNFIPTGSLGRETVEVIKAQGEVSSRMSKSEKAIESSLRSNPIAVVAHRDKNAKPQNSDLSPPQAPVDPLPSVDGGQPSPPSTSMRAVEGGILWEKIKLETNRLTGQIEHTASIEKHPQVQKYDGFSMCWISSLQTVFAHHGCNVNREDIVSRLVGLEITPLGELDAIARRLSGEWHDANGRRFQVECRTDSMFAGESRLSNYEIAKELSENRPMVYCTFRHAMVLAGVKWIQPFGVVLVVGAVVLDPSTSSPDIRQLNMISEGTPASITTISVKSLN